MSARRVALVTGATGFVGRHLAARLAEDAWDVHALVRGVGRSLPRGVREVTIPESIDGLISAVGAVDPSVCFHLATHFLATHTPPDLANLVAANVGFGTDLAEAVTGTACCPFVDAGTAWQRYEGRAGHPTSLYAATKQAFADVLAFYSDVEGLPVATLELFDTYGPGDTRPKLVPLLFECARTGKALDLSPGAQLIDLLHTEDAVDALLATAAYLLAGGPPGKQFGARSDGPITLRALVALVEDATGRPIDARWGARPYRAREMFTPWPSPPAPPGWAPSIGLPDGLREIAAAEPAFRADAPSPP